ncbi:hypothetical protein V1514DRAFT_335361 [Lipomyces japonicus]|uniref:uncharacterized protein n=1 Tax=Lipomyces japonicus TaxID=56871 RepID=UPI0034CF485A
MSAVALNLQSSEAPAFIFPLHSHLNSSAPSPASSSTSSSSSQFAMPVLSEPRKPKSPAYSHAHRRSTAISHDYRQEQLYVPPHQPAQVPTPVASAAPVVATPKIIRGHAHRRSAAMSRDVLADIKQDQLLNQVQQRFPITGATTLKVSLDDLSSLPRTQSPPPPSLAPARPESPCTSSASLASSSATSLVTVSSASTSPPAKAKVMFSSAIEFIPSHSTTTSTSTTTTITPSFHESASAHRNSVTSTTSRSSLSSSSSSTNSEKRRSHKKVKSWAGNFIRFRSSSRSKQQDITTTSASSSSSSDNSESDDEEFVPPARPATPPKPSRARAPHYFTRTSTPEPMIDLDAALGPSGTPPLLSGARFPSSGRHKRSESAPEIHDWTYGTRSVDFKTFSDSISRAFPLPDDRNMRGMKRKMSVVTEEAVTEEKEEEDHNDDNDHDHDYDRDGQGQISKSLVADFSPCDQEELVNLKEEKRRSVWEDFVSSFATEHHPGLEKDCDEPPALIDDFSHVILGEPGPEIRHDLLLNSSSTSTTSSSRSAETAACPNASSLPPSSAAGLATNNNNTRRRSLVISLKNAITRSQSAGNLAKLEDKLNHDGPGWKSHSILPSVQQQHHYHHHNRKRSLSATTASPNEIKNRGIAHKVWTWVRGIVAA